MCQDELVQALQTGPGRTINNKTSGIEMYGCIPDSKEWM